MKPFHVDFALSLFGHDLQKAVLLLLIGVILHVGIVHPHDVHAALVISCNQHWRIRGEANTSALATALGLVRLSREVDNNRVQRLFREVAKLNSAIVHCSSE